MIPNCIKRKQIENKVNAMIETITNSNGTAIKFSDGIMIAFNNMKTGDYDSSNYCSCVTWNYPIAFISSPNVFVSAPSGNNNLYNASPLIDKNNSKIYLKGQAYNDATKYIDTGKRDISVFAIGRWK